MSRGIRGVRGMRGAVAAALAAVIVVALSDLVPHAALAATERKVRHVTLTFVDRSRAANDPTGTRSADARTLVTEVYIPRGKGTFPLIVMAHGNAGNPGKLTQLLTAWARAGYVVVAPRFPLTNDATPGQSIIVDVVNQPADISFVIDRVLRAAKDPGSPPLGKRVDAEHIGLAGHSLGGATVYGVAYNSCCEDERIDAVVTFDAVHAPFGEGRFRFTGKPLLMIHIIGDPVVPFSASEKIYALASPPEYLMALNQGIHFEPFENAPSPHDKAVLAATDAFWDGYLRNNVGARRRVITAGTEPGLSTVTAQLKG